MGTDNGREEEEIIIDEHPLDHDRGAYFYVTQEIAGKELAVQFGDLIRQLAEAYGQLTLMLEVLRESAAGANIDHVLNQQRFIENTAGINKLLHVISEAIKTLIQQLSFDLQIDEETQKPALNGVNIQAIIRRVTQARMSLRIVAEGIIIPGENQLIVPPERNIVLPDAELTQRFQELCTLDRFNDPRMSLRVAESVSQFLSAANTATERGLISVMRRLMEQMAEIDTIAQNLDQIARNLELFFLEPSAEDLMLWDEVFEKLARVIPEAILHLRRIYGQYVEWAIKNLIDFDKAREVLWKRMNEKKALEVAKKERREKEREGEGQPTSLKERLMLALGETPPPSLTHGKMRATIDEVSQIIDALKRLVEAKNNQK